MSGGSELKSKGARALREAGFRPLPRWWVKAEDLDLISYMVGQYADEVNRIRTEANNAPLSREEQIELAWKRHNP
jgi:hypothetical protein